MKKGFKFVSRLIVGVVMIILAVCALVDLFNTVAKPKLPTVKGAEYVQDVSGSMSEPDKTYARNAIEEAASENKIAIVLDYQLTTFQVTDTYIDKMVSSVVKNIYRNQNYVVYTYFSDTDTLYISTNINDTQNDVVSKTKEGIDTDAKLVKEILYYQQNLSKNYGLKAWNFSLNTEYAQRAGVELVGFFLLLILGIGVLPSVSEGLKNPFRRKKRVASSHSE